MYRAALHAVVDGGRDHEARQGGNGVARVQKAMFMLRAFGEREGRLDRDGEDAGCSMKATTATQCATLRVRQLEQRGDVRAVAASTHRAGARHKGGGGLEGGGRLRETAHPGVQIREVYIWIWWRSHSHLSTVSDVAPPGVD